MTTIESNVTHGELVTYDSAIKEWIRENYNIQEGATVKVIDGNVVIIYEE